MTEPTIFYICGAPYCGSTLLNLLLDSQRPLVRGLGEPCVWYDKTEPCRGICYKCGGADCVLEDAYLASKQEFYRFAAQYYGASALVDSSTRLKYYKLGGHGRYIPLMITKSPWCFAESYQAHRPEETDLYLVLNVWVYRHKTVIEQMPEVHTIRYYDLVKDT
jgi:hypothetical protein